MPRISEEAKYYIFMHETKRTMSLLLNKSMKRLKKFKEEIDA